MHDVHPVCLTSDQYVKAKDPLMSVAVLLALWT